MGAALYVVLESDIDGLDASMSGKSLSRHLEALDEAARDLEVRPLSEFVSIDPEQAAAFAEDEGADVREVELPPLEQFSAADGLVTVRALMGHATAATAEVLLDLLDCERILAEAARHGVGWHLVVDF